MGRYYIEKDGKPVESTLAEWGMWFERGRGQDGSWRIGLYEGHGWHVSTVFLGMDYSYGEGPPLVYESLATQLGGEHTRRYSTREEAAAGHADIVSQIEAGTLPKE